MELFDALGPKVTTALSDKRDTLPRALFLTSDAATQLAHALVRETQGKNAVVLLDVRTRAAAADACGRALREAGFAVHELLVPDVDGEGPSCDETQMQRLKAAMPVTDVIVGVGSGVISDLAKWIAFELKLPAAIFGTAASMNGYAAANVAPSIAGVKTLIHARAHRIVAADPRVLAAAPFALNSAGLGDVIAKTVSTADWKMNEILFGEAYDAAIASIIDHVQEKFLNDPSKLATRDETAISGLFEALVYSGCAMTLQGSSLPASGGEHLISHALDMRAHAEGGRHDLHGRQVGLGTIFAAALYERVLSLDAPHFVARPLPLDRAAWGPIADAVAEQHHKQSARLASACQRLREADTWQRLRTTLRPMLPGPAWVKTVLSQAGAAHRVADIGIDRERFLWAVYNSAQIRERFTSIDLGWATGVLPTLAESIVDEYLVR